MAAARRPGGDEVGRGAVRHTIVGGRPRSAGEHDMTGKKAGGGVRYEYQTRFPVGIERVLCLAASDAAFRDLLLADPIAAVAERDLPLTDSERRILGAASRPALTAMLAGIDLRRHGRRPLMASVLAATLAATTVSATIGSTACSGGSAPGGGQWNEPDAEEVLGSDTQAEDAAVQDSPPAGSPGDVTQTDEQ